MTEAFPISVENLPEELVIFPLPRVILLPRVQLPLNIFEPRYLAMVNHAMSNGRLIGMIQPKPDAADGANDQTFTTGCAGRITSFSETEDGRYLITLKGVCRFDVAQELPLAAGGYRRVKATWQQYHHDLACDTTTDICRDTMMTTLRQYLDKMQMFCDKWETIRNIECEKLISTLSVVCPFSTEEKQALLEAPDLPARAKILHALLEIAAKEEEECKASCH
ncbi:MAG TPA: LON peptidase substrate-binding domain-containing protein [Patescibacteria group bacterium]|nr:LON peptidase substrate-binding domain-containing protein [Patescibacteria group bacterium]